MEGWEYERFVEHGENRVVEYYRTQQAQTKAAPHEQGFNDVSFTNGEGK